MAKGRRRRGRARGGGASGGGASGPSHGPERLKAPGSRYVDAEGNALSLRGSLTAKARQEYAQTLQGLGSRPADTPEDRAQRAAELLFERLAVRWEIAGAPIESQRELLQRYRFASRQERAFVRRALREHCEEHFPDIQAP